MTSLLISAGWTVELIDWKTLTIDQIVALSKSYDVIYLLKVPSLELILKIRNLNSSRIVFDLTDALWLPQFIDDGWAPINKMLSSSNAVFCCNFYDKEYAVKHNQNVAIIPPYANVLRFDELKNTIVKDKNKVVIGWVGSVSTAHYLLNIKKPLERLSASHKNLSFHVVGKRGVNFGFMNTTSIDNGYSEDTMICEIFKMDIGVFPITKSEEDYVTRGPLKIINYMAGSVPVICYNAGECAQIIQDGVNGMLAKTEEEWYLKLDSLVKDDLLREKIGNNGYNTVKGKFSKEESARILILSLEKVLNNEKL